MDVVAVVSSMVAADLGSAELVGVREHLASSARVRAWLDVQDIAARRRLEGFRAPFGATPDQETARAGNLSRRDAEQVASRAAMLDDIPELEPALANGAVTVAHVDVLHRGLKTLEPADRQRVIADQGARLARLAARQTPDEYAKTVKDTVAAAQTDGGLANLLPVCTKHHHAAHDGGWHLHLNPRNRTLTITYADGSVQTTGPPRASAG